MFEHGLVGTYNIITIWFAVTIENITCISSRLAIQMHPSNIIIQYSNHLLTDHIMLILYC